MDSVFFWRGFLFGLFLGWLYLKTRPTPPQRAANIKDIPSTKDLEEIREKLRKAAG